MPRKIKGSERIYYSKDYRNFDKNIDYIQRNATYFSFAIKAPTSEIPNLLRRNIYGKYTVNFGSNPTRFRNSSHEKETRKEFNAYRFQSHWVAEIANLVQKIKYSKNKATKYNALAKLKTNLDIKFNHNFKQMLNKGLSKSPTGKFFGKLLNKMPSKERLAIENEILQGSLTTEDLDKLQLIRTQWEEEYLKKKKQYEDGEVTEGQKFKGYDEIRKKYSSKAKDVLKKVGEKPFENGFKMPLTAFANWVKNYLGKTTIQTINGKKYRILKKDKVRFNQLKEQLGKTEKEYQEAFQMRKTVDQIYKEGANDPLLTKTLKFLADYKFAQQENKLNLLKDNLKGIQSAAAEEAGEAIGIDDLIMFFVLI